ncbi:MAG: methyltransferase domain-containing protein [Lachnospiraceae bacterium]|nr:methyltransferase domain-containing protein [Lachnospiraceae bacterium]
MKTEWDYTNLADAYLKRPDYAQEAIDKMLTIAGVKEGDKVCDVGAGVAHLTLMLAAKGLQVCAVEPNDAMRANGIKRTREFSNVAWFEGVGEDTRQPEKTFKLVTFGSSFNVTDRQLTLKECHRILVPNGYFACMWNHRVLTDPLQEKIENIIKNNIPGYSYGTRREDQTEEIEKSGLFDNIVRFEGRVVHKVPASDIVDGWRSHATVERQAGDKFDQIIREIEELILSAGSDNIDVPYVTRVWMARAK